MPAAKHVSPFFFAPATGPGALFGVLMLALCFLAAPAAAAPKVLRAPAEAERLYQELGSQMTCTCGCREMLLACSHNNCPAKPVQQGFLRKLCEDAANDAAAIRTAMADRFGERILQAPSSSLLYPLLVVGGLLLLGLFGALVWAVAGRSRTPPAQPDPRPPAQGIDPVMESRIERELREIE